MKDLLAAYLNLLRLHTAGFEALAFVIGPLLAGWEPSLGALAWLGSVGVVVNGYIFALNDLVDLPKDRLDPAKARSPLVSGKLPERAAVLLAVCLPLLAAAMTATAGWAAPAQAWFLVMLALGAFVNVYQKVTDHPVVMDALFAVTMAAPLPVCTLGVGLPVTPVVWLAAAVMFFLCWQLNSIAGNCKDLASDLRTGFKTVATSLGARLADDGTLRPGLRYTWFCWTIHGLTTSLGVLTLAVAATSSILLSLVLLGAVVAGWWGVRDLSRLLRGRRPPARRGREWYFAAGGVMLLGAVACRGDLPTLAVALGAVAGWEALFAVYWSWYWSTARPRVAKPLG
ncbi:UbiA family prenyltransferase [Micromonosporaceae bacterium B7E4]